MSLRLGRALAEQIEAELARAYPEEGCGALLGSEDGATRTAVRAIGLDNARTDSRHNRYVIPPEQFLAVDREAREKGLEVLGFYHSHPDHPARPSAFDLEHAWPYYSYVIVSVVGGRAAEMTSWRLAEDRSRFDPEPIERLRDVPDAPPTAAAKRGEPAR